MWSVLDTVRKAYPPRLRYSFCGRSDNEVSRLVAGSRAFICDECIAKCAQVLHDNGGFLMPDREPPQADPR